MLRKLKNTQVYFEASCAYGKRLALSIFGPASKNVFVESNRDIMWMCVEYYQVFLMPVCTVYCLALPTHMRFVNTFTRLDFQAKKIYTLHVRAHDSFFNHKKTMHGMRGRDISQLYPHIIGCLDVMISRPQLFLQGESCLKGASLLNGLRHLQGTAHLIRIK